MSMLNEVPRAFLLVTKRKNK